jgi:DNA (cytosine-5)-methyltransferase 1
MCVTAGAEVSVSAYYNENDPATAAWLRELIHEKLIADGEVDTRSIVAVRFDDVKNFTQCHFFAGIGGWSYALRLAGWSDDRAVWTGSCPCQPFSGPGTRRGRNDERHLWPAWFGLIRKCKPATIFGEQVEGAVGNGWLDDVYDDLERESYAIGSACLPAASVDAFIIRHRTWFVADTADARRTVECEARLHADRTPGDDLIGRGQAGYWDAAEWLPCTDGKARPVEPGTFPMAHGLPARLVRLRGYGNAIVPQLAAAFIGAYCEARSGR